MKCCETYGVGATSSPTARAAASAAMNTSAAMIPWSQESAPWLQSSLTHARIVTGTSFCPVLYHIQHQKVKQRKGLLFFSEKIKQNSQEVKFDIDSKSAIFWAVSPTSVSLNLFLSINARNT